MLQPRSLFHCGWRLKALLTGLALSIVFALGQVGEPLENGMRMARDKLRSHSVSGSIVVVSADDRSIAELGPPPWAGDKLGDLVRRLHRSGARRIYLDTALSLASASDDDALHAAFKEAGGRVLLPARFSIDPVTQQHRGFMPRAKLALQSRPVNTNVLVNWDGKIWQHPYSAKVSGARLSSLAAVLGNAERPTQDFFPIDHAINIRSIPILSAGDVLAGRWNPAQVKGKDAVIGRTDFAVEHHGAPGDVPMPSLLFHVLAAETLLSGHPIDLGWLLPLAGSALLAGMLLYIRARAIVVAIGSISFAGLFAAPVLLEHHHVFVEVFPSLLLIATVASARVGRRLRDSYRARGTTNLISGSTLR